MIKTNIELLNEISAKLGGKSDASVLVEGLNNIANALGDTDPDQMVTVPQALETVLEYVDGGGGGGLEYVIPEQTIEINDSAVSINVDDSNLVDGDWAIVKLNMDDTVAYYVTQYFNNEDFGVQINFREVMLSDGISLLIIEKNSEPNWSVKIVEDDHETIVPGIFEISMIKGF